LEALLTLLGETAKCELLKPVGQSALEIRLIRWRGLLVRKALAVLLPELGYGEVLERKHLAENRISHRTLLLWPGCTSAT